MILDSKQKRQRILMMVTGAFVIFFTGYPHVWSIYQPYVMEQAGWTSSQASMCFYLSLCTFVFGNIAGGRLSDRGFPRMVVFIGGGIFAAGILLSALCIVPSPIPIYLTYGVMQGFGQGMIYSTIISTAQKWFPERPGFASGIIVTANGLCGFFMAPISRMLLSDGNVSRAFLFTGIAITIAWGLSTIFFDVPEKNPKGAEVNKSIYEEAKQYTSGEMVRTVAFYYLLLTMLFGLVSYFLISPVSQTYQIDMGITSSVAVSAVMIGSIVNASARLLLPTIADKVGRIVCVKIVLIISVAAMLVLGITSSYAVTAAIIVMYGCYGGIMGSFPALTSSIFGIRNVGENYGVVMIGLAAASIGAPVISSIITSTRAGLQQVFLTGAAFAVIAVICLTLLQKQLKSHDNK